MIRTYRDFVEEFRGMYTEEIKQLIQQGHYESARSLLFNIILAMENEKNIFNFREIPNVHCGLSLLASIRVLYNKLKKTDFDPKRDILHLEAFLAQTKLPTQA